MLLRVSLVPLPEREQLHFPVMVGPLLPHNSITLQASVWMPQEPIYIADRDNHRIRAIDAVTGIISTIAGTGVSGYSGDGGPALAAQFYEPTGVYVDASNILYIADYSNHAHPGNGLNPSGSSTFL